MGRTTCSDVLGALAALVFAAGAVGCGSSHGSPPAPVDGSATRDSGGRDGSIGGTECMSNADCGTGNRCHWEAGCGVGHCVEGSACTADVVEYMMCDGTCATGSSSCPPGPYVRAGCDPGSDGGVGTVCGGRAGTMCGPSEYCDYPDGVIACGGDDSTGICRVRPDACPEIYSPVCGCDNATYDNGCFANAGGTDIAHVGACSPSAVCTPTSPCTGGETCTGGPSCASTWSCVASGRLCTDDEAAWCGCDGMTFYDSSTCPTRPYLHFGPCETMPGVSCDQRRVLCDSLPPTCPPEYAPSVRGSCWGECVPIVTCACTTDEECPPSTGAVCAPGSGHCALLP